MNEIRVLLEQILNGVAALGFFAPAAFVFIYLIGTVLFVPTVIFALAAGALFGVPMGFVVASASSLAVASGGFWMGRNLSRGWILKKVASNKQIRALDDAVAERGWKFVLLLRLSAILPFTILNYALGLSRVRFKDYFSASLIGLIPGTLLYVYLGSLAGKMVFENDLMQKSPIEWVLIGSGLAVTLLMAVYSTLVVKKAFKTLKPTLSTATDGIALAADVHHQR